MAERTPIQDEDDPDLPDGLYAMRFVMVLAECPDDPAPMVSLFWDMKANRPKEFIKSLNEAERDWQNYRLKREAAKTAKRDEKDIGEEKARKLIDDLFESFEKKEKKEAKKDAATVQP